MTPGQINLTPEEIDQLLKRLRSHSLEENDYALLGELIRSLLWLGKELEEKKMSIDRLRKVFGIKTESAKALLKIAGQSVDSDENSSERGEIGEENKKNKKKRKQKRSSAADFKSAKIINIVHEVLRVGDLCPECGKGRLRELDPGKVIRITGQSWLQATIYQPERLRCSTCGRVFTARLPKNIATSSRYDEAAKTIVTLLKYRGGFPFYRQEKLQSILETPISDTHMWQMTRDVAESLRSVFYALIQEGAKGKCLHNDDTKARVLDLMKENKFRDSNERTGIFTSVVLSILNCGKQIAFYFTGRKHAGENLNDVLDKRPKEMQPPVQMCDALAQNNPVDHDTNEGNCLTHCRRNFFEILDYWPDLIMVIMGWFSQVFHNDYKAAEQNLDDEARLKWHQKHSEPIMKEMKDWCDELLEKKKVEPNSSFGKAIAYLQNHWNELTLFLRAPGVPLSNNAAERMIKQAVLNRKNAYFFKTEYGAWVGDVLLSVIETCQLNKINPYNYLIAIQTNEQDVACNPTLWFPWNYHERVEILAS